MSAQLWPRKKNAHAALMPRAGEPWWVGLSFLLVSLLLCLVLSQAAHASSPAPFVDAAQSPLSK